MIRERVLDGARREIGSGLRNDSGPLAGGVVAIHNDGRRERGRLGDDLHRMRGGIVRGRNFRGRGIGNGSGSLKRERLGHRAGVRVCCAIARACGGVWPEVKDAADDGGEQQSDAGCDQHPTVGAGCTRLIRGRFVAGIEARAESVNRNRVATAESCATAEASENGARTLCWSVVGVGGCVFRAGDRLRRVGWRSYGDAPLISAQLGHGQRGRRRRCLRRGQQINRSDGTRVVRRSGFESFWIKGWQHRFRSSKSGSCGRGLRDALGSWHEGGRSEELHFFLRAK